jgi:hypothetical protein
MAFPSFGVLRNDYIKKAIEADDASDRNHYASRRSPADTFRSALNRQSFKTGDKTNHQSEKGGFEKSDHDIINQQTA